MKECRMGFETKIQNIVGTVSLKREFDLRKLDEIKDKNITMLYEPLVFPGIIIRMKSPKAVLMVFKSGKVVVTGGKSRKESKLAIKSFSALLRANGIEVTDKTRFMVQNIVVSVQTKKRIDLELFSKNKNVEYEPNNFLGVVYRLEKPKCVTLIFGSGKLVITGLKKESDIEKASKKLYRGLKPTFL
jgi:transcription initiation factor TFIID TATA-box-binding protein